MKWEQTATYNIGLDYGFLNNRINGAIDIYDKKTTNLLNTIEVIPGTNFANQIVANVGNMDTKGIEVLINATPVKTQKVTWDVGFNFTYSTRKITKLTVAPDPTYIGFFNTSSNINGTGNYVELNSVGYQPNAFFVYKQVYDKTTGKPIENLFEDLNRDGAISTSDFYRYKSPYPRFIIGFSTSVRVDRWTLSTTLHGNIGNYVYNQVESNDNAALVLNPLNYLQNATTDIYNTNFKTNGSELFSDYYVQNASFLKMDNVGLSYDFGKIVYKKYGLMANVSVQNVFTITKYKGLDPEVPSGVDNNLYPRPRIYMLGVNLNF
jgi:iron complex outermembrane receptor protein